MLINKVDVIAQNTNFYLVETKQIRFFFTILLECERHVIDKELLQVEKYILLSFWKHNIVQSSNKNLSRHNFGDKLCKILLRQIRERSSTQDSEETVNRNIFTANIAWLISSSVSQMAKSTRRHELPGISNKFQKVFIYVVIFTSTTKKWLRTTRWFIDNQLRLLQKRNAINIKKRC